MRILMAVPKFPFPVVGGLERQTYELAKALIQRGHVVHVVSSCFDPAQSDFELVDGVRVHRLKWFESKPARFLFFPFGLTRTLFKLRREVDLVHVHNISWFGAFVTLLGKTLGLPVFTKLPNIGDFGIPGVRRSSLGLLRIALLKASDAIIAMTPESLMELDSIGYPLSRVLKVTNGIDLSSANPPIPRRDQSGMVRAIFVGRLSAEKGLLDLLHTWATIKGRASRPVMLCIVGDGPQAAELRALTVALDLSDSIKFLGYCENVSAELAKADLFVLPSYAEGNSNAILEAMHAGLPLVTTNVGGAAIQVGREGAPFLVAPGDRQALADRLLDLVDNETLRWRLGAAMRVRVENVFAIDRIGATYEQAYELLLSGRREQLGRINWSLFERDEMENLLCAG